MNSGCGEKVIIGRRQQTRVVVAAASALLLSGVIAGCVPAEPESAATTSAPSATASPSSSPIPTPDPLILPGCDTLLPLNTAKQLYSPATEALSEENTISLQGNELPEAEAAIADATVTKNCVWGIPNSDGTFSVAVADISEPDREALSEALVSAGYQGSTSDGLTVLELEVENGLGSVSRLHYFAGDVWISVVGPAFDHTSRVADVVLEAVRVENPTRTY